ncbi:MAG: HlyD family efflux transporter periplasmic adaptor subunit [Kiritimatiellae bacterium]|nr:HlyD family efflux transporter periplasmic adaptor subunit [Kiritimatiellia bacterium]
MKKGGNKKKLAVFLLVVMAVGGYFWWRGRSKAAVDDTVPTFTVEKGPLTISVTTGGSIQSRDKEVIKSELEGNNTVIWVVEEGQKVQKGDLLLEFDSSDLVQKRDEQEITVANTEANLIIAEEKLGITEGDCEGLLLEREVDQMLAKMAQEKYQKGDYPQAMMKNEADIALADEEVNRASEKLGWSKQLFDEGFLTKTELQADELSLKQKKLALDQAIMNMSVLTNYTKIQEEAKLQTTLRKAERALTRVRWQNKANLRQVETELNARRRERDRATNRLAELNFQIDKSKIYSPTNGIILYASTVLISRRQWWVKPLAVGSTAVERQELIYIPLESGMVVEVMIPEASLNKISQGMTARVKVDAFPGEVFEGKLVKIGLLPDGQSAQLNPDLKLYKCEIECDFKGMQIRPGMSCDVELLKDAYDSVFFAPVQCVVRVGGVPRVYVKEGDGFVPRVISVGLDNNRMIHITDGVKEGDVLMLAPPVKEQKREESGDPDKSKGQGRGENPESEKHRAVPPDSQPGPSGERPRRGGGGGRPRNVDNGAGEK